MALIKNYGDQTNDPGEWFDYGQDPDHAETVVRFRVRRISQAQDQALLERYGDEEKVQLQFGDKQAYIRQRILGSKDFNMLAVDRAVYEWLDCENLLIELKDEQSVRFFAKHLPKGTAVALNEEVALDGLLNDTIKRYILTSHLGLANWIHEKAQDLEKRSIRVETSLAKN